MYRIAIGILLTIANGLTAQEFGGTYVGTANGTPTTLELRNDGAAVAGIVSDASGRYAIQGQIEGGMAAGNIIGAAAPVHFHAEWVGGNLRFTMYPIGWNGQPNHEYGSAIVFAPAASATAARPPESSTAGPASDATVMPPEGTRDPVLVGSWMKEDIHTDPNFSFVSVTAVEFHPNGQFLQYDGGSAGGSADISLRGTPHGDVERARWRTENGILHLSPEGVDRWIPLARYYVEGGRLLITYLDDGRREIWYRR